MSLRVIRGFAAALFAVLIAAPAALAAPGDLDATFGSGGVATAPFTQGVSEATHIALDPTGRLVAVGRRERVSGGVTVQDWVVARFLADGSPDLAFNGNGRSQPVATSTVTGPFATGGLSLAIQPDGNILVGGQTNGPVQVGRLHGDGAAGVSDGSPDTSFGTSGVASIAIAQSTRTEVRAIALQPDGKVVAAGSAFVGGHTRPFVARFTTAGQPDATFDSPNGTGSGIVFTTDASCDDIAAPDCDGESLALTTSAGAVTAIFVGGGNQQGDLIGGRIFKLVPGSGQSNFATDASWGTPSTPGALQIDRTAVNEVYALVLDSGRLVGTGLTQSGPSYQCGIVRVLTTGAGSLDGSFGTAGAGRINHDATCLPSDLAVQGDGRYVIAGFASTANFGGGTLSAMVGRFNADGHPDATFAADGAVSRSLGSGDSFAEGLVLQGGKPVVAGGSGSPSVFTVARFAGGDGGSTAAPTVSLDIPSGGLVPRHDLTLTGSGDGSSDVSIDLYTRAPDATKTFLKTLTADRSGSRWSLSTTLPDGAYVAQARQSNGSAEGHSADVTFFVDTQSPDLTIDRPANAARVDDDGRPVFSGRAGAVQNDRATVTVLLSGPQGAGGAQNVQRTGGTWSLRWPTVLPPGHYTATATQSDQLNNETSRSVSFDISLASKIPFAVDSLVPSQQVRHVPQVAGTSLAAARKQLAAQLVYVDVDYDFGRGKEDNCADKDVGLVRQQSPAAGDVVNSVEHPTKVKLKVCVSGDNDVTKTCDLSQLRDDLKRLKLGADDFDVVGAFLAGGKRCQDEYDVRIRKVSNDDAQPKVGKVTTVNRPGKRRDEIRSVVDCPRDPEAQDLRVYVSDGTPANNKEFYGFKANGSEGWTLPADHDSAFRLTVTDRAGNPVSADVFVDPAAVDAPGFTRTLSHTDSAGSETFRIHPGSPGTIDLCVVNDQGPGPALFGTVQLRVVNGPKVDEVYETTNGRRLVLHKGFTHPAFAQAANVFDDVFGFIRSLFGGKSKTVNAAAASSQKSSAKLDDIHDKAQVTPAQVNTCGGALDDRPKPPVVKTGPLFGQVDNSLYSGTGPVVAPNVAASCGAALVGVQQLSAAEGRAAGLITNDGGSLITNDGGSIVAQGGGNIVAQGGGNIVAQGGGNIVAQGGGNIVAQGGGNIVASGAGNLGPAYAQIVAQGGGNIVAQGGGNIVAQGGGNFLP